MWRSGTVHKALVEAVKKTGQTVDTEPGAPATKEWLEGQLKEARGVKLDQAARELVVERLGEDLGRVPALLDGLEATYGPGARLSEDDVEPFLGEAGGVPPWELTDAIDRGDTAAALDRADADDGRRRAPSAADHGDAVRPLPARAAARRAAT